MKTMIISSPNFVEGGLIPKKFTCQGEDIIPELNFSNIPSETKSMVLIVDDPDAPMGTWDHLLMWNIPHITRILEGQLPAGVLGRSSSGNFGYEGPCPPSGTHRYFFKVYALDRTLSLEEGSSKSELESAMKGHIIAHGELMGLYKKG